jgi:hypothetical protein
MVSVCRNLVPVFVHVFISNFDCYCLLVFSNFDGYCLHVFVHVCLVTLMVTLCWCVMHVCLVTLKVTACLC